MVKSFISLVLGQLSGIMDLCMYIIQISSLTQSCGGRLSHTLDSLAMGLLQPHFQSLGSGYIPQAAAESPRTVFILLLLYSSSLQNTVLRFICCHGNLRTMTNHVVRPKHCWKTQKWKTVHPTLYNWVSWFRSQESITFYYIIQYSKLAYHFQHWTYNHIKITSPCTEKFSPRFKPKISIPYVIKKKVEAPWSYYVRGPPWVTFKSSQNIVYMPKMRLPPT